MEDPEKATLSGRPIEPTSKPFYRKKGCIVLSICCCLIIIALIIFLCIWFIPSKKPENSPIFYTDAARTDRFIVSNLFVTPIRNPNGNNNLTTGDCGQLQVALTLANSTAFSPSKSGCETGFYLPSDVASQATLLAAKLWENSSLLLSINNTLPSGVSSILSGVLIPDTRNLEFRRPQNFSVLIGDASSSIQYLVNASVFYDTGIPLPSTYASYMPHQGISSRWYIDGHDYMEDAYYAISNATSHIYITDWWLMPTVYLIRFPPKLEYRLDILLARKAAEGVKIRILLYDEISLSLPRTVSDETQQYLEAIHPNIKVFRHGPPILLKLRWSHHQKTLIIDDMIAFVGGLDLTYGRWDFNYHPITDPLWMSNLFPGPDYQMPETTVDDPAQPYYRDLSDRTKIPREPWHDTQIGVEGWTAVDVSKNFVERWNNHIVGTPYATIPLPEAGLIGNYSGGFLFSTMRSAAGNGNITTSNETSSTSFSDNGSRNSGNTTNSSSYSLAALNYDPNAIPSWDELNVSSRRDESSFPPSVDDSLSAPGALRCQVVRSIAPWSGHPGDIEQSIQNKMLDLINNAERFIYIENQFFISSLATATETLVVYNVIGEAVIARIARAIRRNEKFRVIIITPVHPEGDVKAPENAAVLYLQMYTLFRGDRSIYGVLQGMFPNVTIDDYIHFGALRNYGFLLNQTLLLNDKRAVTSQVYVHSKTMMVDDRHILIGSANINDRSLNGDRDSELCIHCENEPDLNPEDAMLVPMNGVPYRVSRFVHAARMSALNEHMGLRKYDSFMSDLLDDTVYQAWRERATTNAAIYEQVFPSSVQNNQTTWAVYDQAQLLPPRNPEMLRQIRGFLVEYPRQFLSHEEKFWPKSLNGCPTQTSLTNACDEIVS